MYDRENASSMFGYRLALNPDFGSPTSLGKSHHTLCKRELTDLTSKYEQMAGYRTRQFRMRPKRQSEATTDDLCEDDEEAVVYEKVACSVPWVFHPENIISLKPTITITQSVVRAQESRHKQGNSTRTHTKRQVLKFKSQAISQSSLQPRTMAAREGEQGRGEEVAL